MALRNKRLTMPAQLAIEEELQNDLCFLARAHDRSPGGQILHYIRRGVEEDKRKSAHAQSATLSAPPQAARSSESGLVRNSQRRSA